MKTILIASLSLVLGVAGASAGQPEPDYSTGKQKDPKPAITGVTDGEQVSKGKEEDRATWQGTPEADFSFLTTEEVQEYIKRAKPCFTGVGAKVKKESKEGFYDDWTYDYDDAKQGNIDACFAKDAEPYRITKTFFRWATSNTDFLPTQELVLPPKGFKSECLDRSELDQLSKWFAEHAMLIRRQKLASQNLSSNSKKPSPK